MNVSRTLSTLAIASMALLLVACPKKNAGGADAAADAAPADTTVVADAAPATTTVAGKPVVHAVDAGHHDGGAMDAGAVSDGGATAGDGGASGECCCQVGTKLSNVSPADCAKAKGTCAKKEVCDAKSCCCDQGGTKTHKLQSDCSAAKGKCVAKEQCH